MITKKRIDTGHYRILVNSSVVGDVYYSESGLHPCWIAHPAVDGVPRPDWACRRESTMRQAIRWLTEGPQWEVRVPGMTRWSEHLDRVDAETEARQCAPTGAIVQPFNDHGC